MKPQIIKLLFALNTVILAPMLTEKKNGPEMYVQQLQTVAQLSISSSKLNLYIELMIVDCIIIYTSANKCFSDFQ